MNGETLVISFGDSEPSYLPEVSSLFYYFEQLYDLFLMLDVEKYTNYSLNKDAFRLNRPIKRKDQIEITRIGMDSPMWFELLPQYLSAGAFLLLVVEFILREKRRRGKGKAEGKDIQKKQKKVKTEEADIEYALSEQTEIIIQIRNTRRIRVYEEENKQDKAMHDSREALSILIEILRKIENHPLAEDLSIRVIDY